MAKKTRGPPPEVLWAYAYDITLPDSEEPLRTLQALLDQEHLEARNGARTWGGQVVLEPQVTRILVVSDSPAQDREVNRKLEAELRKLKAIFAISVPLAVGETGAA